MPPLTDTVAMILKFVRMVTDVRRVGKRDRQIDDIGIRLRALLDEQTAQGLRVAGFGAPAKLTTMMHRFGLTAEHIEFVVDDSPWKQGLYTPGLRIPVYPVEAIAERKPDILPDILVVFAWNFAEPIIAKHREFAEAGERFVVPLPEPVLV